MCLQLLSTYFTLSVSLEWKLIAFNFIISSEKSESSTPFGRAKLCTKVLYDASKLLEENDENDLTTLPQLVIEEFDDEQVTYYVETLRNFNYLAVRRLVATT